MKLVKHLTKKMGVGVLGTGLLFFILTLILAADSKPIVFESLESKTFARKPVFNRVRWFPGWKEDVWMMQQSHAGLNSAFHQWDRIAIVVDKTRSPRVARYYQFEPGDLTWNPSTPQRPLRAACFICHSNGPRALRPNFESKQAQLSYHDRLRILLSDLRIKTYGRVVAEEPSPQTTQNAIPFRYPGNEENHPLQVRACVRCHNDSWWGRGFLTRQNFGTIGFMTDHGFMPPPGFRISPLEKKELFKFRKGLILD